VIDTALIKATKPGLLRLGDLTGADRCDAPQRALRRESTNVSDGDYADARNGDVDFGNAGPPAGGIQIVANVRCPRTTRLMIRGTGRAD